MITRFRRCYIMNDHSTLEAMCTATRILYSQKLLRSCKTEERTLHEIFRRGNLYCERRHYKLLSGRCHDCADMTTF